MRACGGAPRTGRAPLCSTLKRETSEDTPGLLTSADVGKLRVMLNAGLPDLAQQLRIVDPTQHDTAA